MICVTMFITGGLDGGLGYRAEVLAWLDEEQQWVEEGKMPTARGHHAVTTINYEAIATFCG